VRAALDGGSNSGEAAYQPGARRMPLIIGKLYVEFGWSSGLTVTFLGLFFANISAAKGGGEYDLLRLSPP
jgi:hypothetical protein